MLAEWLMSQLPEWNRELSGILEKCAYSMRRDLWSDQLIVNYMARMVIEAKPLAKSEWDTVCPQTAFLCTGGKLEISIVGNCLAIESDLLLAWHPSLSGSIIRAQPKLRDFSAYSEVIKNALELISIDEVSRDLVSNHCAAISIVETAPALGIGQCVSLCSKAVPGLIYVSEAPTILMSESVVHEAAHQMLYAIMENNSLFTDDTSRILTPLRRDPRPISGLLHQVWVLKHLIHFYEIIVDSERDVVRRNRDKIFKRIDQHEADYCNGIEKIMNSISLLTPYGREIVSELRSNFV